MAEALGGKGYVATETPDDADMILLNTCHIREKASEKVYSDLGRLRAVKATRTEAGKATLIAVAGCVAQAEGAEISARAPIVDLVFGPQTYHRLPELVARDAALNVYTLILHIGLQVAMTLLANGCHSNSTNVALHTHNHYEDCCSYRRRYKFYEPSRH